MDREATFWQQGWFGQIGTPCTVIGETKTRFRVRLIQVCKLPGRDKRGTPGQILLMPKDAITFRERSPLPPPSLHTEK